MTIQQAIRGPEGKGASLAVPLAGHKRRRPEQASGGWASLSTDLVCLVTDLLLDSGDIVDYVFRAVCSGWRACTPTPRQRDPALRDPRLRPRGWIALCDGDAVRPDDAGEIDLFHTRTARRLRVRLPDLQDRRIIGFSDGLLVLLHKTTGEIRVLNPFTRVTVDFPSLASVYPQAIKNRGNYLAMKAAVCNAASSSSSIAVVVWFPNRSGMVAAEACLDRWEILHRQFFVSNTLVFQGRLYSTTKAGSLAIVQLYPPTPARPPPLDRPVAVAQVPNLSGLLGPYHTFLVESCGQMLLVVWHQPRVYPPGTNWWWKHAIFTLYKVDLHKSDCAPVSGLLDRALFLGTNNGCVSVSAIDLPSLSSNSIYFSAHHHPVLVHSLTTGLSEELAAECQIHDGNARIRASVRPFTIIDHLLTFCRPKEWTQGLMFHEYHRVPICFKELWKKMWAHESQLRIPPVPSSRVQGEIELCP
ncbi:unnamed protein product [Alopecurus aequalis]